MKIKSSIAIAQQMVEKERGNLEVAKLKAEANRILQLSLTENFLKYKSIEKWNGELPKVSGGDIPFINIDKN